MTQILESGGGCVEGYLLAFKQPGALLKMHLAVYIMDFYPHNP